MTLLRRVLGETLRGQRLRQRRTLREVSGAARVSLGYLSEVERGQKEASSELLASICEALDVRLSEVLREVSDNMRRTERTADVARAPARQLVPAGVSGQPGGGRPAELPVGRDGAEYAADFDLPADFDRADLADRVAVDGARAAGPVRRRPEGAHPVLPSRDRLEARALDPDQFGPDQFGPDQFGPDQFGPDHFGSDQFGPDQFRPDQFGPDGLGSGRLDPDQFGADVLGPDGLSPDQRGPDQRGPDQRASDQGDPDQRDPDQRDAGRLDGDQVERIGLGPERFEPGREDRRARELDRIGLDGVDLAELETGDGFGDVETLLSLTDLSCCLDRSPDGPGCLAGAVVAA
jgi:transcriptional regulator with XRE-family HTH domain